MSKKSEMKILHYFFNVMIIKIGTTCIMWFSPVIIFDDNENNFRIKMNFVMNALYEHILRSLVVLYF